MKIGAPAVIALVAVRAATAAAVPCESLAALKLPGATITTAQLVAAGAFGVPNPEGGEPVARMFKTTPAFCRVALTLKPTNDSAIRVEVWMPAAGWNGKLQGQGNGGFAGSIDYNGLAGAVTNG